MLNEFLLHEAVSSGAPSRRFLKPLSLLISSGLVVCVGLLLCTRSQGWQYLAMQELPTNMAAQIALAPGSQLSWGGLKQPTFQRQVTASSAPARSRLVVPRFKTVEAPDPPMAADLSHLDSRAMSSSVSPGNEEVRMWISTWRKQRKASWISNLKMLDAKPEALSEFVTTNAGVQMPRLIYTTSFKKERTQDAVLAALRSGFKGFDTASGVGAGERALGEALQWLHNEGGISRESLFIQTKIDLKLAAQSNRQGAPIAELVESSILNSLRNLQSGYGFGGYIDSIVLRSLGQNHLENMEAWDEMENAFRGGVVRQLGISDVGSLSQLKKLYAHATIKPAIVLERTANLEDQSDQHEIRKWCAEMGIYFQQTATLSRNRQVINSPTMKGLAAKYGVTPSVLFTRFMTGQDVVLLRRTLHDERMKEDVSALRVPLSAEDAKAIADIATTMGEMMEQKAQDAETISELVQALKRVPAAAR